MLQRTIENYPGSKGGAGTYHVIINQIPPISTYIEAFAGGAAVAHHLQLPKTTVINDIDSLVMQRYEKAGFPAILTNMHYQDVIAKFGCAGPSCLVFMDPPYLMNTRSCQRQLYNYDWEERDHIALLNYVSSLKCNLILSHYPCELYDKLLILDWKWRAVDYQSMTRAGMRDERLYINYPVPTRLHDYRYLGKDFTQRQHIKRKISRLESKMAMLPALERNAIIKNLVAKYGTG